MKFNLQREMVWPLGINPEFDRNAAKYGLAHWTSIDSASNSYWLRSDGRVCNPFQLAGSWPAGLEAFDKLHPLASEKKPGKQALQTFAIARVEELIRESAHMLIAGNADQVAGAIVATLIHKLDWKPSTAES